MSEQHIVVLSGAGISVESGLPTFRGADGLWENHRLEEVATPEAFARDPDLVLRFYNERRKKLREVEPNAAHLALARLQEHFRVSIITQNIDDLHERAGSRGVLHLHGELKKARSVADPAYVVDLGDGDIAPGDTCPKGGQLRPHVVWFGEAVPALGEAAEIVSSADALLVVGTSLQVYPAASLVFYAPLECPRFLVDPSFDAAGFDIPQLTTITAPAAQGVPQLVERWIRHGL